MKNAEDLLILADSLVRHKTDHHLSDLQRILLLNVLQGVKRSYKDIAEAYNYSPRYLRQNVAAKLWQLLSQALACKVSKSNVRSVLECQMQAHATHSVHSQPSKTFAALEDLRPSSSAAAATGDILIVNDHLKTLSLLSHTLEQEGHHVWRAISGKMALELMSVALPDVILLDINLPEPDGYSLCHKLKDNPVTHDTPVIFVSALDEDSDKTKAFSVGGNDYITKPFETAEVVTKVHNQLNICRLQQTLSKQTDQLQAALLEIAILKRQWKRIRLA